VRCVSAAPPPASSTPASPGTAACRCSARRVEECKVAMPVAATPPAFPPPGLPSTDQPAGPELRARVNTPRNRTSCKSQHAKKTSGTEEHFDRRLRGSFILRQPAREKSDPSAQQTRPRPGCCCCVCFVSHTPAGLLGGGAPRDIALGAGGDEVRHVLRAVVRHDRIAHAAPLRHLLRGSQFTRSDSGWPCHTTRSVPASAAARAVVQHHRLAHAAPLRHVRGVS